MSFILLSFSFRRCNYEHSVFVLNRETLIVVFIIYMDDTIVSKSDVTDIEKVKNYLKNTFKIKDLELLCYFLGIEVAHSRCETVLS